MFSDEPLNLNQTRTNKEHEDKLIFLHIYNTGRLIIELDDKDVGDVFDQFVNFLVSVGYNESIVWDTIAHRLTAKKTYENIRKQFGYLDKASDIM
jgi:hypothetical protein